MITRDEFGAVLTIDEVRVLRNFIGDQFFKGESKLMTKALVETMRIKGVLAIYNEFKGIIANLED